MRAEERREQKLAEIREQIASGKLTVRQMTPAERLQQPPARPIGKPKPRARGRG